MYSKYVSSDSSGSESSKALKRYIEESDESIEQTTNFYEQKYWIPKFLISDGVTENEYESEWRRYLVDKNSQQIENSIRPEPKGIRFTFYGSTIVKCIYDICRMLKQPPEVKYLAVDIFDRFLIIHFFQVAEVAEEMGNLNTVTWETITSRMYNQALLRMLSCVQLAAKYSCNSKMISTTTVQELLESFGCQHRYSKKSIVKSEARLYQALEYNIPMVTPLTYIEMFLEDLHNQTDITFSIPLHAFLKLSVDVLDVAIVYHQGIYARLMHTMTGKWDSTRKEKLQYLVIEGDYMYLATSVIYAASILENPTEVTTVRVIIFLCSVTEYTEKEIRVLGNLILEAVLRN